MPVYISLFPSVVYSCEWPGGSFWVTNMKLNYKILGVLFNRRTDYMKCCHCKEVKLLSDFSVNQLECKLCNQRRYNAKRKPNTRRNTRHKKYSKWSRQQIELLKINYRTLPMLELKTLVDKSYPSINNKAKEIGLRPLWQGRD